MMANGGAAVAVADAGAAAGAGGFSAQESMMTGTLLNLIVPKQLSVMSVPGLWCLDSNLSGLTT